MSLILFSILLYLRSEDGCDAALKQRACLALGRVTAKRNGYITSLTKGPYPRSYKSVDRRTYPDQTFALVLVPASTKMGINFVCFYPPLWPCFDTPKTVETRPERRGLNKKRRSLFYPQLCPRFDFFRGCIGSAWTFFQAVVQRRVGSVHCGPVLTSNKDKVKGKSVNFYLLEAVDHQILNSIRCVPVLTVFKGKYK
jgi:hypothetical protein